VAQMLNPTLTIKRDKNTKTVKATVNCDVRFSQFEQNMMKNGARFTIGCELWGDDDEGIIGGGDSLRYSFRTRRIVADFDGLIFSKIFVEGKELDEDNGNDEIYGRLILRSVDYQAVFFARTAVSGGIHL
jgi:hypothetical protein